MTEQKLISKLQELKQIKPRKDWAFSVKMSILGSDAVVKKVSQGLTYKEMFSGILSLFNKRKLAYAFAVFLFVFAGGFGFMKVLPNDANMKISKESTAALVAIKSDVEIFKVRSKTLSEITKTDPKNVSLAVKEVKSAAKSLTDAIQKDPQLVKSVALEINNNKTYLDIVGGNDSTEVNDLYKTVVDYLIEGLEKNRINLTEDQKKTLDKIADLRDKGRYVYALESILLLNASIESEIN